MLGATTRSSFGAKFKNVAVPLEKTTFIVTSCTYISTSKGVVKAEGLGVGAVALGESCNVVAIKASVYIAP